MFSFSQWEPSQHMILEVNDKIRHWPSACQRSWQTQLPDQLPGINTNRVAGGAVWWWHCHTMWWHISYSVKLPNRCKTREKVQDRKLTVTSRWSEDDLSYERSEVMFTAEFSRSVNIYWATTTCEAEFCCPEIKTESSLLLFSSGLTV